MDSRSRFLSNCLSLKDSFELSQLAIVDYDLEAVVRGYSRVGRDMNV